MAKTFDVGKTKTLKNGQEFLKGTVNDDTFIANEDNLDAGDIVDGLDGEDTFRFFADGLGGRFAAFELRNIERFEVTNDAENAVTFDLSGSKSVREFAVDNSSQSVNFTQIAELDGLTSLDITNTTTVNRTDVTMQFRDIAVAGANAVTLNVADTDVSAVQIGSVSDANGGVETINLNATGAQTFIDTLDSDITTLNVAGLGDIEITSALNATIRVIDASNASGALDLDFSAATGSTTVTGSTGDNTLTGGAASDTVTTFGGDDVLNLGNGNNVVDAGDGSNVVTTGFGFDSITTGDGSDVIDAGEGNNTVRAGNGVNFITTGNGSDSITGGNQTDVVQSGDGTDTIRTLGGRDTITVGTGRHLVDAGKGNDTLVFGGNLDASVDANGNSIGDVVDGGSGSDTLVIDALNQIAVQSAPAASDRRDDERFDQVRSIEVLQITTAGRTYLGGANSLLGLDNAQAAGIRTIQLRTFGNDDLDASTFSSDLKVDSFFGGSDSVLTGSGTDVIRFYGTLDDTDIVDGGDSGGRGDTLIVTGSTTLTTASQFSNIETLRLTSGYTSNGFAAVYNVTLDNDNRSSTGTLTVDASGLKRSIFGDETLTLNASAVTAYRLVVTGGNANDVLQGGALSDEINAGNGNDTVTAVGGDTVNAGNGNDTIILVSGNNVANGDAGRDTITLGTGNDTVNGGEGDDLIVSATGRAADQLTAGDTINGGAGSDTLRVQGLALTNVDFTGLTSVEVLDVAGRGGSVQLGAEAQAGGIRTVLLSSATASVLDASDYSANLLVDAQAGGNDRITTGSGDDRVIAGVGNQDITLGMGDDTVVVDGNELDNLDVIKGGAGTDTIELDNLDVNGDGASVSASVNLDNVRDVERYAFSGNGTNPNNPFGNVTDTYTLSFRGSVAGGVGSLTEITVDASKLSDTQDVTQIVLEEGLQDADYGFTILGSSTSTQVFKRNDGVNNNINFFGAGGGDALFINGSDLGSTTVFSGGGGRDLIHQTGGLITDDSYRGVSDVEVLTATGADAVNAILGSRASASGLVSVVFDNANANSVELDAGFTSDLEIVLGDGNDQVLGGASVAKLSIVANVTQVTSADQLVGGSLGEDNLELHIQGDGTADLTNATGIETINMVDDTLGEVRTQTRIVLNTAAADVATQTFNAADAQDGYYIDAAAASADLVINLSESGNTPIDVVVTGSGNDTVDLGSAGFGGGNYGVAPDTTQDHVDTGDGNDTVTGAGGMIATGNGNDTVMLDASPFAPNSQINLGAGDDTVTTSSGNDIIKGDVGSDVIRAGAGSDAVSGGADRDSISGGDGDDFLSGGAGVDVLTGGAGADQFFYGSVSDSSTPMGRDTISDFQSLVDKLDFRDLLTPTNLGVIAFAGNAENFADAQGSVTAGSGMLQVVFEVDRNIVWVDANDDGTLDANDIQIKLTGVSSLDATDVFAGADTTARGQTAFDAAHGLDTDFFVNGVLLV